MDLESEPKLDPKSKSDLVEQDSKSELESESEVDLNELESDSEEDFELDSESESELEVYLESESKSESELEVYSESKSKSESKSESDSSKEEVVQEGRDNRVELFCHKPLPYKWICSLKIKRKENECTFRGSGFMINFLPVGHTVVVTAGHCVWDKIKNCFAEQIEVTFPEMSQPVVCKPEHFYAPPEFKDGNDKDYDYGLIIYKGASNEGFGWTTEINKELTNMDVTNAGYSKRRLLITGGETTKFTKFRVTYKNDTTMGQSGSPIYGWYHGYWTVIGIHTHGRKGLHNSGRRFDLQMISQLMRKIDCKKALTSATGSIRCYKSKEQVLKYKTKVKDDRSKFYIYPIAMTPSVAPEDILPKVVIECAEWKSTNRYINLDSKDMTSFKTEGGGDVNWKYECGPKAEFYLKKEGGSDTYSFISVKDPHFRIRVGPKAKTAKVNCQYYTNIKSPSREGPYAATSAKSYNAAEESEKISIIT